MTDLSFLLGRTRDIKTGKAKRISDALKKSCSNFCKDEGVKKSMSVKQKWQDEAKTEGIQEGIQQGAAMLADLIKAGMSPDEALEKVCS